MSQENAETEWPPTELQRLEPRGMAKFTLSLDPGAWTLAQGRVPVALIKRSEGGHNVRTASEEWEAAIRRHGRVSWRLELARMGEQQAAIYFVPRGLLTAGRVDVPSSGRAFRLRAPHVRNDWRLTGTTGRGSVHIAVRRSGGRIPAPRREFQLTADLAAEPRLAGVILTACVAILVQRHGFGGSYG